MKTAATLEEIVQEIMSLVEGVTVEEVREFVKEYYFRVKA